MAVIPYQTVGFVFGALESDVDGRDTKVGNFVLAENVRQVKRGTWRKRPGHARLAPTFSGGAWTNPTDTVGLLPGPGQTLFTIDGAGMCWCYDADANVMRARGKITRIFPQHAPTLQASGLLRPRTVIAGNNRWDFGQTTNGYYFTVTDIDKGTLIQTLTKITATSVADYCPVYDGTNVWVIWCAGTATVKSDKFDPANPGTAPTTATYTSTAGSAWRSVDCWRMTTLGETAVVLAGDDTTLANDRSQQSYLNPATGAAKAGATNVDTAVANGNGVTCPSIFNQNPAGGGSWYYTRFIAGNNGATTNQLDLELIQVNATTLATTLKSTIASYGDATGFGQGNGITCGYIDGNGDRVFFDIAMKQGDAATYNYFITKHVRGSVSTDAVWARGSWLASKPFQVGTTWYVLTGFDDNGAAIGGTAIQTLGIQRQYHLRDTTGSLVCSAINAAAGGVFHQSPRITTAIVQGKSNSYTPAAYASGNVTYTANAIASAAQSDLSMGVIGWDFGATFGIPAVALNRAVVPSGIPVVFGHQESLHEICPLQIPNYMTVSGAPGVVYDIAAVYRIISPDGTVWRSAPLRSSVSITNGATLTFPTLRHLLSGTTVQIEFYASTTGLPALQFSLDNDPTVDTLTATFSSTLKTDEVLYNVGGALSNAPPAASRFAATWNDRVFLTGNPEGSQIWFTQEFRTGFGLQFNEVLIAFWQDGSGPITAIGSGGLYLGIFREDATGLISGDGPDGRGNNGSFQPQTLQERRGTINWRSLALGPKGLLFQSIDGLMYQLTGTTILEAFKGMQDYGTLDVVAAQRAGDAKQGHTLLFQSDGGVLCLDTSHPLPEQPLGVYSHWSTGKLLRAYGACIDSNGSPIHLNQDGTLRVRTEGLWTDADGAGTTPVLKKLKTGLIAAVGENGAFNLSQIAMLGRVAGACDFKFTVGYDSRAFVSSTKTVAATGRLQLFTKPDNMFRIHECEITLEEVANAGGTEGIVVNSLALTVQPLGGVKYPEAGETV